MTRRWLWAFILLGAVAIPLVYMLNQPRVRGGSLQEAGPLADYGRLADFTLTTHEGEAFTSQEMRGGPWIANFIFTRCPAQCPMMSAKFATLQRQLKPDVRLVSFSVDPANDTPKKMKEFSKPYGPQPGRWVFLTGDAQVLKAVRRSAHVGDDDDPDLHSLRFVLVDKEGHLRGYYDPTDSDALKKIRDDVERLRKLG